MKPQPLSLKTQVANDFLPVQHEILVPVALRTTHRVVSVDLVVRWELSNGRQPSLKSVMGSERKKRGGKEKKRLTVFSISLNS